ncbi:hypothetical protein ONS95_006964 [Cadophora gregata]|uniref:uncharacterized protein n=1 Tax=Cadophora gregata TaxID=51156 RepID=UPI0026DD3A59|nr:uncharacterized protein ONS95_006964 [Cadophora gregata]KAK0101814.1 hypothetical protein ONS95_006964 [Cadophora gregata]
MAASAAEFLAVHHVGGELYDTGNQFVFHYGAESVEGGDSLVLPLLDRILRSSSCIHPRYALVNIATATPPWHSDNGFFHTLHTMDGWSDSHFDTTLGPEWCEWEL